MAITHSVVDTPSTTAEDVLIKRYDLDEFKLQNSDKSDGSAAADYVLTTSSDPRYPVQVNVRINTRESESGTVKATSIRVRSFVLETDGSDYYDYQPIDVVLAINSPGTAFMDLQGTIELVSSVFGLYFGTLAASPDNDPGTGVLADLGLSIPTLK